MARQQLNLLVSPEFQKKLKEFMSLAGLNNKSQAIRQALQIAIENLRAPPKKGSFDEILGWALKRKPQKKIKFKDDASLWKE